MNTDCFAPPGNNAANLNMGLCNPPSAHGQLAAHWCATVDSSIQLRTGCHALEKYGAQEVRVRVQAWAPFSAVADPSDINQVINYETIFLAIRALENEAHHDCLESSILTLMHAIFAIQVVSHAQVSLDKPHIYKGLAIPSITLNMSRPEWQDWCRNHPPIAP